MAESRQAGSQYSNNHVVFPLHLLPMPARKEIANYFDGDFSRFHILAAYLGFSDLDLVTSIWTRGHQGVQNSATLKLLDEFQQRRGTVQQLYGVLCHMHHYAANIILEWRPHIQQAYLQWFQSRNVSFHTGQQNTCNCGSCNLQSFSHQKSNQNQSSPGNHQYDRQDSVRMPQSPGSSHPQINSNIPRRNSQSSSLDHFENGGRYQPIAPSQSPEGGRRARCNCEKCRLASDPNETQLLTDYTTDKQEKCLISDMSKIGLSQRPQNTGGLNAATDSSETRRYSWNGSQNLQHPLPLRGSFSDGSVNTSQESVEVIFNRLDILHSVDNIEEEDNPIYIQHQNIPDSRSANNSQTNYSSVSKCASNKRQNVDSNETNYSRQSSSTLQPVNKDHQQTQQSSTQSYQPTASPPSPTHPQPSRGRQEEENKRIVFITYSPQSNIHLKDIRKLISILQQAGFRVKIDMDPDCFDELGLNRNEWLDRSMDNADFIIICVSPMYYSDACDAQDVNSPSPRISQLNVRYIYDRLRTEYIQNQSQNRRMIPILFPRSGANYTEHLPPIMQATLVYTFPNQIQLIVDRILGTERNLPYV